MKLPNDNDNVVEGTTCFQQHDLHEVNCENKKCRCWFDNPATFNCAILAAKSGPQKQEQIGKYFGLTRMRVCQIEKQILVKVRNFNRQSQ